MCGHLASYGPMMVHIPFQCRAYLLDKCNHGQMRAANFEEWAVELILNVCPQSVTVREVREGPQD
jgi:hypothetical protein